MELLLVYIVEWTDSSGELCTEWFRIKRLADDYARKVGGIVIEKDVS